MNLLTEADMPTAIKARPIPFTTTMVQALLAGRKTMTRRVVRMPSSWDSIVYADHGNGYWPYRSDDGESSTYDNNEVPMKCPYGRPGDQLWVRETHRPIWGQTPGYLICVDYKADPEEKWKRLGDEIGMPTKWIGGRFMRREYSRLMLRVTEVRIERLQAISEADAVAEGCAAEACDPARQGCGDIGCCGPTARSAYQHLWEQINGPGSWDTNPFVWVVAFERVCKPSKNQPIAKIGN